MGGKTSESSSTTQVINQTTTPQPTAEETALNQRNLRIAQATEGGETQAQLAGLNLVNQLLTGKIPEGIYQQLGAGVNANDISTQATQMMRSGRTGMQSLGISDSGVADRAIAQDLANNLYYPAAQFNVGAMQNLLNLALSGQAQVQAPVQANVNNLSNSLAGLRSTTTSGTTSSSGNTITRNPFMTGKDIFSGIGTGIGAYSALS